MAFKSFIAASALLLATSCAQNSSSKSLPIVDLGYVEQQASTYDSSQKLYTFSNIRFAAPPTGDLRFRAPQPPIENRTAVQNGSVGYDCPSAFPSWLGTAYGYIPTYLNGSTDFNMSLPTPPTNAGSIAAGTSEDCLFLDVVVPDSIFATAGKGYGAPVLVWIYGGGYTGGSKTAYGSPAGLLNQSRDGVVYVAMNYRLGAFGWLSGPTFQEQGGIANAGLYDQRFALEWVRDNIAKFGGDPNRVTIFGESAGGGSIMHQITAFGGNETNPPFQQAVPQSPAWQPLVSNQQQEQIFNAFLKAANVSSLEEARNADTTALQLASSAQVVAASYGEFVYGPAVDGVFSPQLPGQLLARGQFSKNLRLMIGHNADEGLLFTPPLYNNSDAVFTEEVEIAFPTLKAWPDVTSYIVDDLYPIGDYPNEIARSSQLVAEAVFTCNTFYLDKAFNNQTYAYLFAVPPALHGNDIAYTFYNPSPSSSGTNTTIAYALQDYITSFALNGYPNEAGVPYFPMYQGNATIQVLNITGISQTRDPVANQRCNWWQKALYY